MPYYAEGFEIFYCAKNELDTDNAASIAILKKILRGSN
jgi:hypothetical protein